MSNYVSNYEQKFNNLREIVTRHIGDSLDHLTESRKRTEITKLTRFFSRMDLFTEDDIRNFEEKVNIYDYHRIKNSRYAKIVADSINGVYDDVAAKKERLARIDKEITRLNIERENILKVLGGQ